MRALRLVALCPMPSIDWADPIHEGRRDVATPFLWFNGVVESRYFFTAAATSSPQNAIRIFQARQTQSEANQNNATDLAHVALHTAGAFKRCHDSVCAETRKLCPPTKTSD